MRQRKPLTIMGVKGLDFDSNLIRLRKQGDSSGSDGAVHIHQQ
jgi:hypothetical protein